MNDENGKWVTINGTHVFIRDGETAEQALARLSETKKPEKYYKVTQYDYWGNKTLRIVPDTDIDKYVGDDIEELNLSKEFEYLDSLDLNRSRDYLISKLRDIYKSDLLNSFLTKQLLNRIAEHQQTLADEFLSHVGKHKDISLEESVMEVNKRHYDISKTKPGHSPEYAAYTYNCQRCAQAFVLRYCHGYDVEALPSERIWNERKKKFEKTGKDIELNSYAKRNGYDTAYTGLGRIYNGWESVIFNLDDVRHTLMDGVDIARSQGYQGASTEDQLRYIKKMVKNAGDGAVYMCDVCWKGTRKDDGGYDAHVFCILNEGGKVKFVDPQSGEECSKYFTEKQIVPRLTEIFRADNCRLNGTMMKEVVVGYENI